MSRNPIVDLIIAGARARGLDPNAVLAVARREGLNAAGVGDHGTAGVGDSGTSFGPFQLHRGGALPGSIPKGQEQAWASSSAGISYALDQIARVARGKQGAAAINAIVRLFERPANPDAEVAGALASYTGGGLGQIPSPVPTGGLTASQNTRSPDPLLAGVLKANGMPAAISALLSTVPKAAPTLAPQPSFGPDGKVVFAAGADRPGVKTNPAVVQFVSQIAGLYGAPLTIGTGTNHNQHVAGTNRESAHWTGYAADIPASGAELTRLGQDALIAAGMPAGQARRQKGGLFNVGGYQIIFNSMTGGNHFTHLHVGIRR